MAFIVINTFKNVLITLNNLWKQLRWYDLLNYAGLKSPKVKFLKKSKIRQNSQPRLAQKDILCAVVTENSYGSSYR